MENIKRYESLPLENTVFDAFQDSNHNNPRIHPAYDPVIADIEHFTGPQEKKASLLWIHGPCFEETSPLAHAVTQKLRDNDLLGATFFFPLSKKILMIRSRTLFLTIAHQLGIKFPALSLHIVQHASSAGNTAPASFGQQLEGLLLFRNPDMQKQVVVINGLDRFPKPSYLILRGELEIIHKYIIDNHLQLSILVFGNDSRMLRNSLSSEVDLNFMARDDKLADERYKHVLSCLSPVANDVLSLLSHFTTPRYGLYGVYTWPPPLGLPTVSLIQQLLRLMPDDMTTCLVALKPLFAIPYQLFDISGEINSEHQIWKHRFMEFLKDDKKSGINKNIRERTIQILLFKCCIRIISNKLKDHSHTTNYCNSVGLIYALKMSEQHWKFVEDNDRDGAKPPAFFIDGLFNTLLKKMDDLPTNFKTCVFFNSNFNIKSQYPFLEGLQGAEADFIYEKIFNNNICDSSYKTALQLWRQVKKCMSPETISLIIGLLLLPQAIFGIPIQFLNISEVSATTLLETFTEFIRQEESTDQSEVVVTLVPFTGDPKVQEMFKLSNLQAQLWLNYLLENKQEFDLTRLL